MLHVHALDVSLWRNGTDTRNGERAEVLHTVEHRALHGTSTEEGAGFPEKWSAGGGGPSGTLPPLLPRSPAPSGRCVLPFGRSGPGRQARVQWPLLCALQPAPQLACLCCGFSDVSMTVSGLQSLHLSYFCVPSRAGTQPPATQGWDAPGQGEAVSRAPPGPPCRSRGCSDKGCAPRRTLRGGPQVGGAHGHSVTAAVPARPQLCHEPGATLSVGVGPRRGWGLGRDGAWLQGAVA